MPFSCFLYRLCLFSCLGSLLIASAARSDEQSAVFPISFWCGPPDKFLNLKRFQEIKEAGFTHVMPPCGGAANAERNRKILDFSQQAGLKAFIYDARITTSITNVPDAKTRLDGIINDYKAHPALAGYSITDEPGAGAFPGLAEVVAYLKEKDALHPAYINLFPNYASAGQLGIPTYEQYLREFAGKVKPSVLSYDHYHFLHSGDRPLFFANLAVARKVSQEFQLPFWQIVLAVQHGPYRNLTEGELRYEAMQTLAYGGKGLMWFTYWQPDDPSFQWSHAMINLDGSRDPHYDMIKRINQEVAAFGQQLLNADSTLVFHSGQIPPGGTAALPNVPVLIGGKGDFTIGLFHSSRKNAPQTLAFITNAEYRNAITTEVMIKTGRSKLQRFNGTTGQWQLVTGAGKPDGDIMIPLHLPPGGAALLGW